jgi:hypothetical protein
MRAGASYDDDNYLRPAGPANPAALVTPEEYRDVLSYGIRGNQLTGP